MVPVIRRLALKNYRSFASERIELDNPTFLVGQNGAGKSKLVDALAFLAEGVTSPLSIPIAKRGGIEALIHRSPGNGVESTIGLAVDFGGLDDLIQEGHYAFELQPLPNHDFQVVYEQCLAKVAEKTVYFTRDSEGRTTVSHVTAPTPRADPRNLSLFLLSGYPPFALILRALSDVHVYAIDPAKLRDAQQPDPGARLWPDGGNAASVLMEIGRRSPDTMERIGEFVSALLPHNVQVEPERYGGKLFLQFTQEWNGKRLRLDASSMSDGTLRLLGIIAAVFQDPPPSVMILEEPESSIHTASLGMILDLIQFASERTQVIVTTHNPELLDTGKWIGDRHIRAVYWEDGASRVSPVGKASREALQENLMRAGELLRAGLLDRPSVIKRSPEVSLFEPLP